MAMAEAWAAGRDAYEMGATTMSDLARALDVTHQAVSKRAKKEGWAEPGSRRLVGNPLATIPPLSVTTAKDPAEVVLRSAEAVAAATAPQAPATVDWPTRAPVEASAAGLTAAVVRQRLMLELREKPIVTEDGVVEWRSSPQMIRALAEAYRVFIQGAQLLSGEATETIGQPLSAEERTLKVQQVLATIAKRRAEAIEATAADD